MKKAAKVFLILGIIFTFYLIFPIVIGCITISKINSAKRREEIIGWGIASLLLVSTLGGIFTLCISQQEFDGTANLMDKKMEANESVKDIELIDNSLDYIERIKELKQLYDGGALTEGEFALLKSEQLEK